MTKNENEIKTNLLKQIGYMDINCEDQSLSEDWGYISKNKTLSEEFIREFKSVVDWGYISIYQNLSEGFIREFKGFVSWYYLSRYQNLSEEFICEFIDIIDWRFVSRFQNLSEDFIFKYKDKIRWESYFEREKVSFQIIKKFIVNTNYKDVSEIYNCHLNNEERIEIEKLIRLKNMFKIKTRDASL
jgi:hypothetical protein